MSNNKQSSIEWLISQLCKLDALSDFEEIEVEEYSRLYQEIVEQAKAMRKKEMIDFADNYVDNCVVPNENMAIPTIMDVPQYYNETFGGNK